MKHAPSILAAITISLGGGALGGCATPAEEHVEQGSEAVADATLPVARYYVIGDT